MQHPGTRHDLAVAQQADAVADAACELADAASQGGWSAVAVDDAAEALATIASALATAPLGPHARQALSRLTAAATELRTALGPTPPPEAGAPRDVPRPRRRGLGHGWKGIR